MARRRAQFAIDAAAIQQHDNLAAAGLYLARLMQSDRTLLHGDDVDPAWVPTEVGRFHLHEFVRTATGCVLSWGGGGDDILGSAEIRLQYDASDSTATRASYVVTGEQGPPADPTKSPVPPTIGNSFRFSIARSDHIDEDEFVRRALAELNRRQAAYAADTEANVNGDNVAQLRERFLAQHPTSQPATNP